MKVIVSNNYYGSPLVWEYEEGFVERIPLHDFNTHTLLQDGVPIFGHLPLDLFEIIIKYTMQIRLKTRNFNSAFQLCTVSRRACFIFYNEIYENRSIPTRVMLYRLGQTFHLAESFYEEYLAAPNSSNSGLNALAITRLGSLRYNPAFDPWDFIPVVDIQKITVEDEETLEGIHLFPGQFHGDTVWIHGEEDDGVYEVKVLHHPVFLLILCDYTYALIPTRQTINTNWLRFVQFLRRAFGPNSGFYIMVKHQLDVENPFIETTEQFIRL
jgi:hypothetical protein